MNHSFLLPGTAFFCIQDCHSVVAQVEFQGQTLLTIISERKPLIDTSVLHLTAFNVD